MSISMHMKNGNVKIHQFFLKILNGNKKDLLTSVKGHVTDLCKLIPNNPNLGLVNIKAYGINIEWKTILRSRVMTLLTINGF